MVVSIYIRWKKNLDDQGAVQTTWLQPEEFSLNWTSSWRMAVWKKQQYIKDCWLPRQMTCILSLDVKPSQTLRVRDFCLFFFSFFLPVLKYFFTFFVWPLNQVAGRKWDMEQRKTKKMEVKIQTTLSNLFLFFID